MSAATQGKAPIFGVSATAGTPPTFTIYDQSGSSLAAGYINPITSSASVTHSASTDTVTNESGDVVAVIGHGEYLEATFELVPVGATTVADARKAATLPPLMSSIVTAGFDVIRMGPFTDGLNVAGTGGVENSRWIYNGGGSVKISSDGHATVSLPLRRYPGIVGGTAIVDW